MNKEKQIEEIENVLYESDNKRNVVICGIEAVAEDIYNAGYRKQSEGEWEKVRNHKECSRCGCNAPYKKIKAGYHLQDLTNFCPNCGAKMKGGAGE